MALGLSRRAPIYLRAVAEEFGKYQLVRKLGSGGMGEVFLARPSLAAPPPVRPIVIKRILPHLTENGRFLRLFLEEARIAARLNHPNIVQIFELGEFEGNWFVGMEFVDGRDLREVMRQSKESLLPVPTGVACRIGIEAAAGLDHAHRSRDPTGRPLKIVHRDVSPHNILVGFDGSVKLIDFGVAKAANRSSNTRSGILKGKFPYMAPEQAEGKRVDKRIDVFALGIVLWEALTSRFLFRGKSDAATLRLVRACEVPAPSSHNPQVSPKLDAVLLKALAREPTDRYPDASALEAALQDVVVADQLDAGPGALSSYLRRLLPPPERREEEDAAELTEEEVWTLSDDGGSGGSRGPAPASAASTERNLDSAQRREGVSGEQGFPGETRDESGSEAEASGALVERAARTTNLAPQATSFVGRVAELAELHQISRQGARLVTLLGPGGTGKTRLSIEFAAQQISALARGGVWFADLTEATDLDGVCVGVARALDVPLPAGQTSEEAVAHLAHAIAGHGELLMVLDNLEQVASAAASAIERWLLAAPLARFLATSREVLRVPNEVVFEVLPLQVPEREDDIASSEAVLLFLERAQAARPSYQLTRADEAAVAEIVQQLDGMPLAIELAAARMAVLSPAQLLRRLPRRFELLTGAGRDAHARQATLRGAIDWSWSLLNGWEQAALAQLSLFRGGFDLEAARAVLDLAEWPEAPEAHSCVLALREKSLVRAYYPPGHEGTLRYGLYESIREFARDKLLASRGHLLAADRHSRHFVDVGRRYSEGAESSAALLNGLSLERENLYAVFQRALIAPAQPPQRRWRTLEAVLVLDPLLALRGPFPAHLLMLDSALAVSADADPLLRARGLEARGKARQVRWRLTEAAQDYQEALQLAQHHRAPTLEGRLEFALGATARLMGRLEEAQTRYQRALMLQRRIGDRRSEGRTLSNLGMLFQEHGNPTEALSLYRRALEIHREAGDRRFEGITLSNLGVVHQQQGRLSKAGRNYERALAIHRELGNRRSEGIALLNLGDLHRDLEQGPQAHVLYERALAIHREVGNRRFEGVVLACLASLDQEEGRQESAAARYQRSLAVLQEVGDQRHQGRVMAALGAVELIG